MCERNQDGACKLLNLRGRNYACFLVSQTPGCGILRRLAFLQQTWYQPFFSPLVEAFREIGLRNRIEDH